LTKAAPVSAGCSQGIEIDRPVFRPVHAAEVQGQGLVNENPDVVVAREVELLSGFIGEVRVQLESEAVVVGRSLVPLSLAKI
jgi:hypothetical protein